MTAYIVSDIDVSDPQALADYVRLVPPVIERHGGRYLVRRVDEDIVGADTQGLTACSRKVWPGAGRISNGLPNEASISNLTGAASPIEANADWLAFEMIPLPVCRL